MTNSDKASAVVIAETIESLLEERKNKGDRRKQPEAHLPSGIERRSGKDRRNKA